MYTSLTIAGSDSSGGAGIQADIKTMMANGVYAMSAITALTAQNTLGVRSIVEVSPRFLAEQIDAVFEDIRPHSVKTGMIPTAELIDTIAQRLKFHHAKNVVVDPVMVATSGSELMHKDALGRLMTSLLPLATLVTPNIAEAERLASMTIHTADDMEAAAECIFRQCGCAVLVKGGHSLCDANDFLYADGKGEWFSGKRINNPNTHGTGCTLSSAIASNLAKGYSLAGSICRAKSYILGALKSGLNLGNGSGPLNHGWNIK